ncbi:hypothetical protein ACKFKF_29740 [Phormidesmis sp. 146-12]
MYNHNIQYRQTGQGAATRAQLIKHLGNEPVSREELMERSGLTYDQVRRQTKNLSIANLIISRIEGGKRLYSLRISVCLVAGLIGWAVVQGGHCKESQCKSPSAASLAQLQKALSPRQA